MTERNGRVSVNLDTFVFPNLPKNQTREPAPQILAAPLNEVLFINGQRVETNQVITVVWTKNPKQR